MWFAWHWDNRQSEYENNIIFGSYIAVEIPIDTLLLSRMGAALKQNKSAFAPKGIRRNDL